MSHLHKTSKHLPKLWSFLFYPSTATHQGNTVWEHISLIQYKANVSFRRYSIFILSPASLPLCWPVRTRGTFTASKDSFNTYMAFECCIKVDLKRSETILLITCSLLRASHSDLLATEQLHRSSRGLIVLLKGTSTAVMREGEQAMLILLTA